MQKIIPLALVLGIVFNTCSAADLPSGVSVPVELLADAAENGAQVTYKISGNVLDKYGKVLVPAGATGSGRVLQRRNGIIFGGPGKTEVSLETITLLDGSKVDVNAKHTRYGADVRVATIVLTNIFAGFLIKGGGGKLNQGSKFTFVTK